MQKACRNSNDCTPEISPKTIFTQLWSFDRTKGHDRDDFDVVVMSPLLGISALVRADAAVVRLDATGRGPRASTGRQGRVLDD